MAGTDARTGLVMDDYQHVLQSIDTLIATHIGERLIREWVGNPGARLLGELGNSAVILLWASSIWMLVELFEPRFRIRRFVPNDVSRIGAFDLTMVGEFRPYAHLDWEQASLFISIRDGAVTVSAGR